MYKKIKSALLLFLHFSKFLLVLSFFAFLLLFAGKARVEKILVPNIKQTPKTIKIVQQIKYITPTPTPFDWTVEKVDEHVTEMNLPADPRMSTPDELFDEMNSYRASHSINTIQKDDLLCSIAGNRANEQVANGGLDNHAGFDKYAHNQTQFSRMGEVLFGGTQPELAVHVVQYGWDRSLTGHREVIQDSGWQDGCGGIAGYYAVFIFGTH